MFWTQIENTHTMGSHCQNNTLTCAAGNPSKEIIQTFNPKREKSQACSLTTVSRAWCSYIFRLGSKELPTQIWMEQGGTDGGHVKAQTDRVGLVTKSVHLGCCIPPISSTAKSRLFPPFQSLDSFSSPEGGGRGGGLRKSDCFMVSRRQSPSWLLVRFKV